MVTLNLIIEIASAIALMGVLLLGLVLIIGVLIGLVLEMATEEDWL